MSDLSTLETDLALSLPPELAPLAPDLARTLRQVAQGQVTLDQARTLLNQPTTLAILREMVTAGAPAAITVGDIYNSHGVAIGPGARVVYQGPGYPRPDYRSEIATRLTHLQSVFVGRESLLDELATPGASGYVLLTAPAGFGKSAVAAQLVARHDAGVAPGRLLVVFLRQETGENTPNFFLQRLNAQMLSVLGLEGGVPSDLEALRGQFSELWSRLLAATNPAEPLTVVVDGLDEMAPGAVTVATVLPDRLTDPAANAATPVRVLVTSRPNPDPMTLVPLGHPLLQARRVTLDAFTHDEVVGLLRLYGATEPLGAALAGDVQALTAGEPLFARFVAQETAAAGAVPPALKAAAPQGVRAYFALQVAQLTAAADSALTRDILGVLVAARAGLSRGDLADILDVEPLDVGRVLGQVKRFLLGADRLELMHLVLREALAAEFSARHRLRCAARLVEWCARQAQARWPAPTPLYILEQYARHLEAEGDLARRVELATDADFRAAQRMGLGDIGRTLEDVRAALVAALEHDQIAAAVRCAAAYRETLQHGRVGETIFAALDVGDGPGAFRRAAICGAEVEWAQVLWAYLAWEFALKGDVARVQTALGAIHAGALPPLGDLVDGLVVAAARALDGQVGRTAAEWLTVWGRPHGEALLASFPSAPQDAPAARAAIQDLQPMANHLTVQAQIDARSGLYEAVEYFEGGNEEDAQRMRALRERLAGVVGLPEGRALIEQFLRAALPNPYPFYRDQALATLGVAALAVPAEPVARDWLRRQLRAMLTVALTGEGVSFTFELAAQVSALWPAEAAGHGVLREMLQRGRDQVDRWGTHVRTRAALAGAAGRGAAVRNGQTLADVDTALKLPLGYAGYAVTTLLAVADLCHEFRVAPQTLIVRRDQADLPLLEAALHSASVVRDPDFRARRAFLVHAYRAQWPAAPLPMARELAERLGALPERDVRLAYIAHLSAIWSAPGTANWEGLKALVAFALSDATTLDVVLARLVGARPDTVKPDEVEALIAACARDLAVGRPWEYSARIGPNEPAVVA